VLTRVAIYEGTIEAGREDEFFARVKSELEPMWRKFPQVTAVRVLRRTQADADARPTPMILEMDFPSMAAIEAALKSDILPKAHQVTLEVMRLFKGRFYHLVMESTCLTPDSSS
jgi:hypothetical protein